MKNTNNLTSHSSSSSSRPPTRPGEGEGKGISAQGKLERDNMGILYDTLKGNVGGGSGRVGRKGGGL